MHAFLGWIAHKDHVGIIRTSLHFEDYVKTDT